MAYILETRNWDGNHIFKVVHGPEDMKDRLFSAMKRAIESKSHMVLPEGCEFLTHEMVQIWTGD